MADVPQPTQHPILLGVGCMYFRVPHLCQHDPAGRVDKAARVAGDESGVAAAHGPGERALRGGTERLVGRDMAECATAEEGELRDEAAGVRHDGAQRGRHRARLGGGRVRAPRGLFCGQAINGGLMPEATLVGCSNVLCK